MGIYRKQEIQRNGKINEIENLENRVYWEFKGQRVNRGKIDIEKTGLIENRIKLGKISKTRLISIVSKSIEVVVVVGVIVVWQKKLCSTNF